MSAEQQAQLKEICLPESESHTKLLRHLLKMVNQSEQDMQQDYTVWNQAELATQAYLKANSRINRYRDNQSNNELPIVGQEDNDKIIIGYVGANIATIVSFLLGSFTSQRPYFNVSSYIPGDYDAAKNMQMFLQFNADTNRFIKKFHTFFQDGQIYGFGAMRVLWKNHVKTKWEGNDIHNIDPYKFLPDTRVPKCDVGDRGEFAFWIDYAVPFELKKIAKQGTYWYVDKVGSETAGNEHQYESLRNIRLRRNNQNEAQQGELKNLVEIIQGTVEIVPKDFGLSPSEEIEKWLFTIGNRRQIIGIEPFGAKHDKHPIVVHEPYPDGYSVSSLGLANRIEDFQALISWLVNSKILNVRRMINGTYIINTNVLDASKIGQSSKKGPVVIPMKPGMFARDVSKEYAYIAQPNVTSENIDQIKNLVYLGDTVSGVTDNYRGQLAEGGRKTATEVRHANELGSGRMATIARLIADQAFAPLTEIMSINAQQYLSQEFSLNIGGSVNPQRNISKSQISGAFYYPISSNISPLDPIYQMEIWKELFSLAMQNETLAQEIDMPKFLLFIANLGGAHDFESFLRDPKKVAAERAEQQKALAAEEAKKNGGQSTQPNQTAEGNQVNVNSPDVIISADPEAEAARQGAIPASEVINRGMQG